MGNGDFSRRRDKQTAPSRPQSVPASGAGESSQAAASSAGASKGVHLGRARAKIAWGWVEQVLSRFSGESGDKAQKRYGTLARKLPALLQVSGLGQTLAFLFAKSRQGESAEGLLFSQFAGHLRDRLQLRPEGDFMYAVLDLTPAAYRAATQEALAVADWLKRFAEGRLASEED